MNTFLPFFDFDKSAKCLDGQRLRKQNLETRQILNTLCGFSEGWKNHPAVKSWIGCARALIEYGLVINKECINRGFKDSSEFYLKFIHLDHNPKGKPVYPEWLGKEEIHDSHKNRLYCKGEIDIVCAAIKKQLKIRSIDSWLKQNYKKSKNQLKWADCLILKQFCAKNNIDISGENHYSKFGWTVKPDGDYVWPV